jgi:hypothetical protein
MCFSASASFIAGTVLTSIGVATVNKVNKKEYYLFASIPIIFGIQQMTEGFIWIGLNDPEKGYSAQLSSYLFLFIAQVVWPTWVPLSILFLEKKERRKSIQKLLVILGAALSMYMCYCLYWFHIEAKIIDHHIAYFQEYPIHNKYYVIATYGIVTILPALMSQTKNVWILGMSVKELMLTNDNYVQVSDALEIIMYYKRKVMDSLKQVGADLSEFDIEIMEGEPIRVTNPLPYVIT